VGSNRLSRTDTGTGYRPRKKLIARHVNRGDILFNIQGNKEELIRRHENKFFPEGPQRYRRDKPPVQHFENLENTRR